MTNYISYLFKETLKEILTSGEIDNCIKYAPNQREKTHLKNLKKLLQDKDINSLPINALLHDIRSITLLQDILSYMLSNCEYHYNESTKRINKK